MLQSEKNGVIQYSLSELKDILRDSSANVIDVRTEEEYEAGHIPGVPLRSMQSFMNWVDELQMDEKYVFVCRSGNRSQRVAEAVRAAGVLNAANFSGGMLTWDGELSTSK